MDYENREWEISLKSMLFAVLHQWRKMLLLAVVFAMLLGGYKGLTSWSSLTDPSLLQKQERDYQEALEIYEESRRTLQTQIEDLETSVEQQRNYLENSVLMSMDPWNFYSGISRFYVSTEYQIMPEMAYQNPDISGHIVAAYAQMLNDAALLDNVAGQMDIELRYLKELVSISASDDHVVQIHVIGADRRSVQRIMDMLSGHVVQMHDSISTSIGDHMVSKVLDSVGPDIDQGLVSQQRAERDRLKNDVEELEKARGELGALKAPAKQAVSRKSVIKSAALYAVAGVVLGCVLMAVYTCGLYIFGNKVHSGEELTARYRLADLGSLGPAPKRGWVDKLIRRFEGAREAASPELVGLNVCNYARGAKRILVVGAPDWSAQVQEALKGTVGDICLIPGGNLLEDLDSVRSLSECDGVIFAVRCGKTLYPQVEAQLKYVKDMGKQPIGCITDAT